jgi:methylmalonyl-CoA mutase C-terminal domain/subunit
MNKKLPIRVLIAKPGLDGHDKGAKIVARGLADSGMEVIYTGIRQKIDSIVDAAVQEGVDVIGLSILSGTHLSICKELNDKLEGKNLKKEVVVIVGGFIPRRDVPLLKQTGVDEVFRVDSAIQEIVSFIEKEVDRRSVHR